MSTSLPSSVLNTAPVHGFLGNPDWQLPTAVVECFGEARPGRDETRAAHEYEEIPDVFDQKIALLARMIMASKNCIAYTGAGISTGAGVPDYASKTAGERSRVASLLSSIAPAKSEKAGKSGKKKESLSACAEFARPTLAHQVLYRIYRAGWLKWWCQQNHDGLPQKAGVPQEIMNEIHGSWYDPTNRVINFSENIRVDLMADLQQWERTSDLCLAIGTSLSGMNADRLAESNGNRGLKRFRKYQKTHSEPWNMDSLADIGGTVIIGYQCTCLDDIASLRIYSTIDKVFEALSAEFVRLCPDSETRDLFAREYVDNPNHLIDFMESTGPEFSGGRVVDEDVYEFYSYGSTGAKLTSTRATNTSKKARSNGMILDLREGQRVQFLTGQDKDCFATVVGRDSIGNYIFDCEVMRTYRRDNGKSYRAMGRTNRTLGLWVIVSALEGKLPLLTLRNVQE